MQQHSVIRRWRQRFPRADAFIRARLDRSHFAGLPLTSLALAFLYVVALFAGTVEDVITADPIVLFDHFLADWIAHNRSLSLITPFIWITSLGVVQVVAPLLLYCLILLGWLKRYALMLALLLSTLGASAFTLMSKLAFQRPRPEQAVLQEHSFSFPSGHATIAVAFYGFLAYLLLRSARRWKTRVRILAGALLLIMLIGASRIILDVHYFSDVWAGYLVGAMWLIVAISLSEWLAAKGQNDRQPLISSVRPRHLLACGLIPLAWIIVFNLSWRPIRLTPPENPSAPTFETAPATDRRP